MNKVWFVLFVFIMYSCKIKLDSQFTKVKNGIVPYYANTLIIREKEQDTLWATFHHLKIRRFYAKI